MLPPRFPGTIMRYPFCHALKIYSFFVRLLCDVLNSCRLHVRCVVAGAAGVGRHRSRARQDAHGCGKAISYAVARHVAPGPSGRKSCPIPSTLINFASCLAFLHLMCRSSVFSEMSSIFSSSRRVCCHTYVVADALSDYVLSAKRTRL